MTMLIVMTSPRDTDDPYQYLRRTVEQLDAEDVACQRWISVDDSRACPLLLPIDEERWLVNQFVRPPGSLPGGNKHPYWAALELALSQVDDAVIVEDDIELSKNALRRMVTFPVPADCAWVQFFGPHVLPVGRERWPGLWRPPAQPMFTQAVKFPLRTIELLVKWSSDPRFLQYAQSDKALAVAWQALGLRYGVHCPELVQHVGDVSTTEEGGELVDFRRAKTWPGANFDSMKLYAIDDVFR